MKTYRSGDFDYILDVQTENEIATITDYRGADEDVVVPSEIDGHAVTSIASHCFMKRPNIKTVTIQDGILYVGGSAFIDCENLREVHIADSVEYIGIEVFAGCESLESFTLSKEMKYIPYRTFENCDSLTNVTIQDTIKEIQHFAFYGCENLTSVTIPKETEIENNAFSGCPNVTLNVYSDSPAMQYCIDEEIPYDIIDAEETEETTETE